MALLTTTAHRAAALISGKEYRAYRAGLSDIESHQRQVLAAVLGAVGGTKSAAGFDLSGVETADEFRRKVPLTEYADWAEKIEEQRATGRPVLSTSPCERYQPTSGSTSQIKWIPYTRQFLEQVDAFISPLIFRMYRQYPGIGKGSHYWSLSWVPTGLRDKISPGINDDLKLLPWWKRLFMSLTMAVPGEVAQAPTSEGSMFATACYLCADTSLSLISVWSPTFLLSLLEFVGEHRRKVARVLETGQWEEAGLDPGPISCPLSSRAAGILRSWDGNITDRFLSRLWPNLALISAWDTWTSAAWARKLMRLFPAAAFEGKGLLATEGMVTMPFGDLYPLTYRCHFYEFIDLDSGDIRYAWELEKGQTVQPVLTTGAGLLRYKLNDRLIVTGFVGNCPCFVFQGRLDGIDLVGEKLSPEMAQQVLDRLAVDYPVSPLSLLAVPAAASGAADRYLLLCEGGDRSLQDALADDAERILRKAYHYNLARDLNQLECLACVVSPEARALYQYRADARGMVAGNLKYEPIVIWNCGLPEVFQEALGVKAAVD